MDSFQITPSRILPYTTYTTQSPIVHEYHQVRLILDDMNIARIPLLVWHNQPMQGLATQD